MIIGRVLKPRGLSGALRIQLFTPDPRLLETGRLTLASEPTPRTILALDWLDGSTASVRLEGVADRAAAEALAGVEVSVEPEWFTPGNEPPVLLVGAEAVEDDSGRPIGSVRAVIHNGAQAVLVIGEGASEKMVPVVPAFVVAVEHGEGGARRIRIRAIPGLLDDGG